MHRMLVQCVLALVLLFAVSPVHAEGKAAEEKRAKVQQRLKQLKTRVLRQEVGLDEKKADQVQKILTKYEPERVKLQRQHRDYRRALRDLLKADSNDDAEYKKNIEGFRSTQKKLNAVRDKEMDEVAKLITPKQQAKLYAAVERLRRKFARARQDD
ncbi:MAG: periplasmic heavy metal sensor [Myxococcales bacterium]|nr:periplasmic heavy metal sensor [Myxococcales bacterium]